MLRSVTAHAFVAVLADEQVQPWGRFDEDSCFRIHRDLSTISLPKRRTEKAATGAKLLVSLCCAIKRRNGNLTSGYMYEAVRAQFEYPMNLPEAFFRSGPEILGRYWSIC